MSANQSTPPAASAMAVKAALGNSGSIRCERGSHLVILRVCVDDVVALIKIALDDDAAAIALARSTAVELASCGARRLVQATGFLLGLLTCCYYIALSAELFEGFPNIDWTSIAQPGYARRWAQHLLLMIPHPRIVHRRLQRCREDVETLEFHEYFDMSKSSRSKRAVTRRRDYFERWIEELYTFLVRADDEIRMWLP
ncbi:hypothetical protein AURDEDRAFT_165752 [Auricularia subglabra TFB-10046 SS5]|nr:hypothetical protein AURDEDRAFT_165752 [Auricularia subglabra TFB-10046 SS5]